MQLLLPGDSSIKKELKNVPISDVVISKFNPRTTRPEEDIKNLAQRISRNGYEITRALWVYQNGNGYEAFAGGTRLEAAKRAGCKTIPVLLHEGLTEEDIVRLSEEDNENDEYHSSVPCVDVWLAYKMLKEDMGWTQERIAQAKGVSQTLVSFRLSLANLPQSILDRFITTDYLNERHAREIIELLPGNNFSPWLTHEQALLEIIDAVLKKSPTSPTATQFKEKVTEYNALINFAEQCYKQLPADWQPKFLKSLKQTRSTDQIQKVYTKITSQIAEEKARQERQKLLEYQQAEKERIEAELKAEREAKIRAIMNLIICGDAREAIDRMPDNIAMLLTDPPYGKDFQSNRRTETEKLDKMAGDGSLQEALNLLSDVLIKSYPKMAEHSTVFIFSSQEYEPDFRQVIKQAGFNYRGTYIWHETNHGAGDLERTHSPQHECIIHAVKGDPKLKNSRPSSVMDGNEFLQYDHPAKKPLDLLRLLIETWTDEGDRIADPFAGIGSTPIAAKQSERKFWACELKPDYHKFMADELLKMVIADE